MTTNVAAPVETLPESMQVELANARFLGAGRLGLILIASLLLFISAASIHPWILAVLVVYASYAVIQLGLLSRGYFSTLDRFAHWIDAGSYCLIIALAGGMASALSIFLLFPMLVASSRDGIRGGIAVVLVCTLFLVPLGALHVQLRPAPAVNELSLVSITLLSLVAFVITRWGHSEVTFMRRLAFSSDLNRIFTPRESLDRVLGQLGARLCAYERADSCLFIVNDTQSSGWLLFEVFSDRPAAPARVRNVGLELAHPLLSIPSDHAVVYRAPALFSKRARCKAYDATTLGRCDADEAALARLAQLLEVKCFASLPLRSQRETIGRVYVTSRDKAFAAPDMTFLVQKMSQAALMIENMHLVDRLAHEVAAGERKRISRDLHDGTIQPYIGLKLGLEALRRKCSPDSALGHDIDDLLKMADDSIVELRSYVGRLKNRPRRDYRISLLPAVLHQAEKFSDFYGIRARVNAPHEILVHARLFDEIVHIVREGLYNVRRHTRAENAIIDLRVVDGRLLLEIVNDNSQRAEGLSAFMPRSIRERVTELGGRISIEERAGGYTAVVVDIPI